MSEKEKDVVNGMEEEQIPPVEDPTPPVEEPTPPENPPAPEKPVVEYKVPEKPITPKIPEAGGIAYLSMFGSKGKELITVNITARGGNLIEALDVLFEGMEHGKGKYKLSLIRPEGTINPPPQKQNQPPAKTEAMIPPPLTTPARPSTTPPPPVSPPQGSSPQGVKSFHVIRFEVALRNDAKVDLKFYEPNHKFPDIYNSCTPDRASDLLKETGGWLPEHFTKPSTFDVKWRVDWVESETRNSKGNPYKNIVRIQPE